MNKYFTTRSISRPQNIGDTRTVIIANVERLYTYYKKTYQEDEGDD